MILGSRSWRMMMISKTRSGAVAGAKSHNAGQSCLLGGIRHDGMSLN